MHYLYSSYYRYRVVVWYKKEKEGKTQKNYSQSLSKSERQTVLLLASFIPS